MRPDTPIHTYVTFPRKQDMIGWNDDYLLLVLPKPVVVCISLDEDESVLYRLKFPDRCGG